jgi:hypothetical protein
VSKATKNKQTNKQQHSTNNYTITINQNTKHNTEYRIHKQTQRNYKTQNTINKHKTQNTNTKPVPNSSIKILIAFLGELGITANLLDAARLAITKEEHRGT